MKIHFIIIFNLMLIHILAAQNVGIGTTSPSEKLHVVGNINTTGEIKPNGIAGQSNQVLMSNGNGTMQWSVINNTNSSNIGGYGTWGDCEVQNITDFYPVADLDGANNDLFGTSVDIEGDYAIVGSIGDDFDPNEATGAGSVTIYKRNTTNGTWESQGKFYDNSPSNGEQFGFNVGISGDYAVIGMPQEDTLGFTDKGSITILKRNTSTGVWAFHSKFINAVSYADGFGQSVAIDGDYIIAGSPYEIINGAISAGSASIYKRNTSTNVWELQQKIIHPNYAANDNFGYSVSIDEGYAIVGAPSDDIGAVDNGSANVYKLNVSNIWVVLTTLYNGAVDYDKFGWKVGIDGVNKTAIINAANDDIGAITDCGSASIFQENSSGIWTLVITLFDPNSTSANAFGFSVAISNGFAMVGDHLDNTSRGKVHLYKKVGNTYILHEEFKNPYSNKIGEYFGQRAALDGNSERFLIGAPGANNQGMAFFGKIK